MATLGDLTGQLAIWLDADDTERFPVSVRRACVNEAINRIVRETRLRWAEQTFTWGHSDLGDGPGPILELGTYTAPTRMLYPIRLSYKPTSADVPQDITELELPYQRFREYHPNLNLEEQGDPESWTLFGSLMMFGPPPRAGSSFVLDYYGLLADLVEDTDYNLVTTLAPKAVLWCALVVANDFLPGEEPRRQLWMERADEAITQLAVEQVRARTETVQPRSTVRGRTR